MNNSNTLENVTKHENITREDAYTAKLNKEDPEITKYNLDEEENVWKECIHSTKQFFEKEGNDFMTIYIEEPGMSAEIFGPESTESRTSIEKVDKIVGNLTKLIDMEETDLIILSTPGFLEVSTTNNKAIDLDKIAEKETYLPIGSSPVINIKPKKGMNTFICFCKILLKEECNFMFVECI